MGSLETLTFHFCPGDSEESQEGWEGWEVPQQPHLTASLPVRARRWRGPWEQWPTWSARRGFEKTSTPSSKKPSRWLSAAAGATSGGGSPGTSAC